MEFTTISRDQVFIPRQSVLLIQPSTGKRTMVVLNNGSKIYLLMSFDEVVGWFQSPGDWV